MKYLTTLLITLVSLFAWSQPQELSEQAKNVTALFKAGGSVEWAFPLSINHSEKLLWSERKTSFSAKGIRSFVGYKGDVLAGVLSVYNETVSGSYTLGATVQLTTAPNGVLMIEQVGDLRGSCGTHAADNCHEKGCEQILATPQTSYTPLFLTQTSSFSSQANAEGANEQGAIKFFQDSVLRIYRVALAVQPEFFVSVYKSDKMKVRQLWADAESFLNELYMRDIGVKFQVIDDERLMLSTDVAFGTRGGRNTLSNVIKTSTDGFNRLIDSANFDVGYVVCKNSEYNEETKSGLLGLAYTYAVYLPNQKAGAAGWNDVKTMAHEIGHLFGAQHVFTTGGVGSVRTEPEGGTSVMSYGAPMDFFSLVSVSHIKKTLSSMPYYSDKERTKKVGKDYIFTPPGERGRFSGSNAVYGIPTRNNPPVLDRTNLKSVYEVPEGSILQFTLKADDPDGNPIHYAAQQADIEIMSQNQLSFSRATFTTYKPSTNNTITFLPEYIPYLKQVGYRDDYVSQLAPQSNLKAGSEYTFWLSASDPDVADNYQIRNNHAVQYDIFETKVKVIKGTPFKITNEFKKKYLQGETIPLTWDVDSSLKGTNVRILLSDDFGKTFKHVLVEKTPNSGSYNLPVPNVNIGKVVHNHYATNYGTLTELEIPAGVIKIEVIEAPVCAVSEWRAYSLKLIDGKREDVTMVLTNEGGKLRYSGTAIGLDQTFGGFEIEGSKLKFSNLPDSAITVSCDKLPPANNAEGVEATNATCVGGVMVNYKEEGKKTECNNKTKYTYKRIWTASDKCGTPSVDFVQVVTVTPKGYVPIEVEIPADVKLSCEQGFPVADINTVKTKGGCGKLSVTFTDEKSKETCANSYTINRIWIITDECGESVKRVQTIEMKDETAPVFKGELPQNLAMTSDEFQTFNAQRTANPLTLIAVDACDGKEISVAHKSPTRSTNYTTWNTEYTYIWEATDSCGNRVKHQQVVAVGRDKPSVPSTPSTPDNPSEPSNPKPDNTDLYIDIPKEVEVDCKDVDPSYDISVIKNGSGTYRIEDGFTVIDTDRRCYEIKDITYTVHDVQTGKIATITQRIKRSDKTPPKFISTLPVDRSMTEVEFSSYRTPTLVAHDDCLNKRFDVLGNRKQEQQGENKVYYYTWEAVDDCGNKTTHKQTIVVVPDNKPLPPTPPVETKPDVSTPPSTPDNPSIPDVVAPSPEVPNTPIPPSNPSTPNTPVTNVAPIEIIGIPAEIEIECLADIPQYGANNLRGGNKPKFILSRDTNKRTLDACGNKEFNRTHRATNADGSGEVTFVQTIRIVDKTAPEYVNVTEIDFTPKTLSEEQFKTFKPAVVIANDNKCGELLETKRIEPRTDIKDEGEYRSYTYTYIAIDACGNAAKPLVQVIKVLKGSKGVIDAVPTINSDGVPNTDVTLAGGESNPIIYNWVVPDAPGKVFRFNDTFTENIKGLHLKIYTQMGYLVYESLDYNEEVKNGRGFNGKSSDSKRSSSYTLLRGETYFYTFTYKDANGYEYRRGGFIYVDGRNLISK